MSQNSSAPLAGLSLGVALPAHLDQDAARRLQAVAEDVNGMLDQMGQYTPQEPSPAAVFDLAQCWGGK